MLLSNWLGECVFSRSRFLHFLSLRDRFLRTDTGLIYPDEITLYLWYHCHLKTIIKCNILKQ